MKAAFAGRRLKACCLNRMVVRELSHVNEVRLAGDEAAAGELLPAADPDRQNAKTA